jgi:hypothetical protein
MLRKLSTTVASRKGREADDKEGQAREARATECPLVVCIQQLSK